MANQIVNREKLKEKMYLIHWGHQELANFLDISRQSVINKLTKGGDFTEEEMTKLKSKFGSSIFFLKQCLQPVK